ncbi:phosphoribosylglycinamide formyltransferase [Candidatus Nitrotoga arctica]|uniref:Phosphoribosylglycinamide formyltransferase n=1 Tax=Candidatus Nitrotoga arctica TaxID=453162 RepID=A0ABM8YVU7_9PROT|nr:phosphoribosylglycinamide formyltransferase [Candidatus Nitrotoga arctica]CAG9931595.1 phosphoribosylglycinamide formyltransferase 1 [Candidatus Nitrotoga arctica]
MKHKPESVNVTTKSIVILISGHGSNMRALLEADLPCRVAAVISNRVDAPGLEIAKQHGITTRVVAHRNHPDRESFDSELAICIDSYQPDLIVLAGFMRILTPQFVARYQNKLINIHPSLLPAYSGLNTHARALQDGVKIHGCTVHFVTSDVDHGPIIIQAAVPVLMDDTPATLAARVLHQEHRIFPQAIRWFCNDDISLSADGKVRMKRLEQPDCTLISPRMEYANA